MKKTILLSAMAFCGMAVMAHAGVEVNPLPIPRVKTTK